MVGGGVLSAIAGAGLRMASLPPQASLSFYGLSVSKLGLLLASFGMLRTAANARIGVISKAIINHAGALRFRAYAAIATMTQETASKYSNVMSMKSICVRHFAFVLRYVNT